MGRRLLDPRPNPKRLKIDFELEVVISHHFQNAVKN